MKSLQTLTLAATLVLAAHPAAQAGTVLLSTGFESPAYANGQLAGQDGWTGPLDALVQSTTAASGQRALAVDTAGHSGQQLITHALSYNSVANPEQRVQFSVDFMLDGLSPAFVYLDSLVGWGNGGFLSQQVVNGVTGQVCGFNPCNGPTLSTGQWYRLMMEFDFQTGTASNYVNGVLFSTGALNGNSTSLTLVGLGINSNVASAGTTVFFDNLLVESVGNQVPEPGTLALIAGALLALGASRQRRGADAPAR